MSKPTIYNTLVEDDVGAGAQSETFTAKLAAGSVFIKRFGGVDPTGVSLIKLQIGDGATWSTIRAGSGSFEYEVNKTYVGDGVLLFRILRQNRSEKDAPILAWFEAIANDG